MNDELAQKWRVRAHTRGIRIRELEAQVKHLEEQNAHLIREAQTWKAKYKSLEGVSEKIKQTNGYLYKILKRIPGYGEA